MVLLHHERGQTFTAAIWKKCNEVIVSVHGLQQYESNGELTDDAIQRKAALIDMLTPLKGFMLHRVDYAMDMPKIPPRILKRLASKRNPNQPSGSTVYYEPAKQREKGENPVLKIMIYNKADKHNWPLLMMRLEFSLKSKIWPKEIITCECVNDLIEAKGSSTIRRWTGEKVQVLKLIA